MSPISARKNNTLTLLVIYAIDSVTLFCYYERLRNVFFSNILMSQCTLILVWRDYRFEIRHVTGKHTSKIISMSHFTFMFMLSLSLC